MITARDLLNIDLADAGEFNLPQGKTTGVPKGDAETAQNLPFNPNEVLSGEKNIHQFNSFVLFVQHLLSA